MGLFNNASSQCLFFNQARLRAVSGKRWRQISTKALQRLVCVRQEFNGGVLQIPAVTFCAKIRTKTVIKNFLGEPDIMCSLINSVYGTRVLIMNTHSGKMPANKSQSAASAISQKKSNSESAFQLVDNRPEAVAQIKLQEMVNSNPQVKQKTQLQAMENNYIAQQAIQKKEHNTGLPDSLKAGIEKLESFLPTDADEGAKVNPAVEELTKKIKALKQLATGDDEQAKSAEVAALNNELGEIDADMASYTSNSASSSPVQKKENLQVAQRLTGVEVAVGAVIVLGVGLLIRRLFGGNANAAPAPVPITDMQLIGIAHEAGGSFATVLSTAQLTNVNQRVRYDIRWDAAVVPSGNHLGQIPGQASGWVEDLSQQGEAVGNRNGQMARYFDDNTLDNQNGPGGLFFRYMDPIQQDPLNGGSWWFRVQVLGPGDAVLANQEIEVDWRH